MNDETRHPRSERGYVLIAVLFVVVILFVLASVLLLQSRVQHVVEANAYDHLVALNHAEAGLTWAERKVYDNEDITDLLLGPDNADAADDNLLGLRDLSLTSTAQFNNANEATASAIVSRDFDGQGAKSWEVVRINDGSEARALVYVRIDDNYDDDPNDPTGNDPLLDNDAAMKVTVVAEYPVFVDAAGAERTPSVDRGLARRTLHARFGGPTSYAILTNGTIDVTGGEVCGDCGSMHANQDLDFSSGVGVCQDATASGTISGDMSGVGGDSGGGRRPVSVPVINPYDDLYVPSIDVFDTTADTSLPAGLRCPKASPADPGANKYFALVSTGHKGEVWKAYWDFTNNRWTWRMIDDLGDAIDVPLDDCGRTSTDPNYATGSAGPVADGANPEFFGFNGAKIKIFPCDSCASPNGDSSLCGLANNDFNANGHFPAGGGGLVASPRLPGNFQPDTFADFTPTSHHNEVWSNTSNDTYSPLYGAVLWFFGGLNLGGNVGDSSNVNMHCSAAAGCSTSILPNGTFPVSLIAVGAITLSGSANISPANPAAGYHFLLVSGRDISLSGNTQEDTLACGGSCSSVPPSDIALIGGIYAAHEQIDVGGNPNLFGFLVIEDAVDCENVVSVTTKMNGTPEIHYDCDHPPNPWSGPSTLAAWQEIE